MSFTPLHDRVLVRCIEGEVVSVGAGGRREDGERNTMDVESGERILLGKWSGSEIKLDDEDLLITKESDILGVIA